MKCRAWIAALVATLALAGGAETAPFKSFRKTSGRAGPAASTPDPFYLAPAAGTGMGAECAGTDITSAQGDAISITRSSVAYCTKSDGTLVEVAANKPRVSSVGGVLSLYLENISSTNLALFSSDLTQSGSWTLSSMTASLVAGRHPNPTKSGTTLTATGANATALQAITSASSSKTLSVFIKRRTGSGTINVTRNNGTTWVDVTSSVSSSWARIGYQTSTSLGAAAIVNPTIGIRLVTSGDAVDVALFQMETVVTSFAQSSPIETGAATATRAAESPTASPDRQGGSVAAWCLRATFTPEYAWNLQNGSVNLLFLGAGVAANTQFWFIATTTGQVAIRTRDVTNTQLQMSKSPTITLTNSTGHSFLMTHNNATGAETLKIDGVAQTLTNDGGGGTGIITTVPALMLIGSLNLGSNPFRGWVSDVRRAATLTGCE